MLKEAAAQNTAAAAPVKTVQPITAPTNGIASYSTGAANGLSAPSLGVKTNGTAHSVSDIASPAPSSPAPSPAAVSAIDTPASSVASLPPASVAAGPSKTKAEEAAETDPDFAAALARQKERELEAEKLMCSLENKEACLMCSG